jgi:hypothetical protein
MESQPRYAKAKSFELAYKKLNKNIDAAVQMVLRFERPPEHLIEQ